jgi:hypothetical protein
VDVVAISIAKADLGNEFANLIPPALKVKNFKRVMRFTLGLWLLTRRSGVRRWPDGHVTIASAGTVPVALAGGRALLAEVAHHGARHLPPTFPDRLATAAAALAGVGLHRCAGALAALAPALGPADGAAIVRAWTDAQIRLLATEEQVSPDH